MDIKDLNSRSEARTPLPSPAFLRHSWLCVFALFSPLQSADAQEWDFQPYIELAATYTTNLFLAEEGLEESDYIGQIVPGFSVVRDEGRFTTNTEYRAIGLFFASDSDLNTVYHQLRSASTLNAVAERFFVDVNASIEQAVVDPTATIPTSNVVATNNLGDVMTASVNPYYIQPLGSSEAFMRLDYAYDIVRYEDFGLETFSRVDDYDQQTGRFFLGTRQRDTGLEWSLSYNFQSIDYVNVEDYEYERAQAALGVQLSRSFRLIGLGGRETDLLEGRNIGGLDSEFWEVGFRINAGSNSVVEFRTGERFFGDSYFGNIEIEGRRVEFTASYTENPTTSAEGMLGGLVIPFNPNPASAEALDEIGAGAERRYSVAALREEILNTLARRDEQEQALAEMEREHGETSAYQIAGVYSWMGRTDEAFRALDAAAKARRNSSSLPMWPKETMVLVTVVPMLAPRS